MSAPYGEVVADHARHPRNRGRFDAPHVAHEGLNPLCGDRVRLELQLAQGRISAARFDGEACMVALAAASLLTELLPGLSPEDARALPDERLLSALQATLRPSRVACATLPLQVLREALATAPFRESPGSAG